MSNPSPWDHFTLDELVCQCGCGRMEMVDSYMKKLVAVRKKLGFSIPITSGFRCARHNNDVSSTGATGPHTTGHATDAQLVGEQALMFLAAAYSEGMTGIGVKQKGRHSSRFIHTDDLLNNQTKGPRPWIFSY